MAAKRHAWSVWAVVVIAISSILITGERAMCFELQVNTPLWRIKVARPYDPIEFRVNLTSIPATVKVIDMVQGRNIHSDWARKCKLERSNPSTDEFVSNRECTVPALVGFHSLKWGSGGGSDPLAGIDLEVSCTDGIPCNGMERLVGTKTGKPRCAASAGLCNDGTTCTTTTCSSAGLCNFVAKPKKKCPVCKGSKCKPDCGSGATVRSCGFDGCFGQCGESCTNGEMCILGECEKDSRIGTCLNPILLNDEARTKDYTGAVERIVDVSKGLDVLVPKCLMSDDDDYGYFPGTKQTFPRDPEIVFQIDVPKDAGFIGLEVRTKSSLYTRTTTTIIEAEVNKTTADACIASTYRPSTVWDCTSSVANSQWSEGSTWMMKPGRTYFIAVEKQDGFVQPANITVRFTLTPECTTFCPKGVECGPSGCNDVTCGTCDNGKECLAGKCTECIPKCSNSTCGGSDGCGGQCACLETEMMRPMTLFQLTVARGKTCSHLLPQCSYTANGVVKEGCPVNKFCSSDCKCIALSTKLPDLSLMPFRAYVDTINVENNQSCAYEEGCLGGIGWRTVIKFDTKVFNQGAVPFRMPFPPQSRLDLFEYAKCHGHWHTKDFLSYELYDTKGKLITTGQKRSFCLMDMEQVQKRPDAPCAEQFNCDRQGLSVGWTDVYDDSLDCQFIDITDVVPGVYNVKQCVNPKHIFEEASFENNCAEARVIISPTNSPTTRSPSTPTKAPARYCSPGCNPNWVGDGFCDNVCNTANCEYDGGDCEDRDCAPGCSQWGNYIGDGECDQVCNNAACNFDGGDCETTRSPTLFPTSAAPTLKPTKKPTPR